MNGHFFFLLLFITSCSFGTKPLQFGQSTKADIVSNQGQPQKTELIKSNLEILVFENDQKYQLTDDVLTHYWRNPEGEEKFLSFWKKKFENCLTEKITIEDQRHVAGLYELKCQEMGLSVIYSEGNDFIERVVEYEAR